MSHLGAVVIPGRVGKPRDKAKAENSVQQVEEWVNQLHTSIFSPFLGL